MSEFDKSQNFDAYATDCPPGARADQAHSYTGFAPTAYAGEYVVPQAQVPSGISQHSSNAIGLIPSTQQYGTHDQPYYGQQAGHYSTYLQAIPRSPPQDITYAPSQGQEGTRINIFLRSVYDFDSPPVAPLVMFGHKRCETVVMKTGQQNNSYQYAISTDVPALSSTNSPSTMVPIHLVLDDGSSGIPWQEPTIELGSFNYIDGFNYQLDSPQMTAQQLQPRKRKLSPEGSPRRSPTKKPSLQHLGGPILNSTSPFRRPSAPEMFHGRRFSNFGLEAQSSYAPPVPRIPSLYASQAAPSMQNTHSPLLHQLPQHSPSHALSSMGRSSQLMPSPANGNPTLVRTPTNQRSPTAPMLTGFNSYTSIPVDYKASLEIVGNLDSMTETWSTEEWEVKRRLVQFHRTQSGSIITATFEPVALEDRVPNSTCVSCIWWAEKNACYVTSVDTIALLESLVAVRFTVEEKNRIRRNLEGFRPATVSKAKPETDEFFKLIMGFPNPKPRNIEKDVKVFPWRILAGALKKIISKYASHSCMLMHPPALRSYANLFRQSASYSPNTVPGYVSRVDSTMDHHSTVSPHSQASSGASSYGHTYANVMVGNAYASHGAGVTGLGIGPSPSMIMPSSGVSQPHSSTSWQQPPSPNFQPDLTNRAWYPGGYLDASLASGLPGMGQAVPYQQRIPSLTGPSYVSDDSSKFAPMHDYDAQSHPPSSS